jgi:hypothetical protein
MSASISSKKLLDYYTLVVMRMSMVVVLVFEYRFEHFPMCAKLPRMQGIVV